MDIIWVWLCVCVCVRKNRTQKYAVVDNSFTCDMDVKAVWDNGGVLILTSLWLEFPLKFQLIQLFKECIEPCMLLKHGNSTHFNYFLTNIIHTWHSMLLVCCVMQLSTQGSQQREMVIHAFSQATLNSYFCPGSQNNHQTFY